eukprot:9374068-Pyramimonas_sp.AAC.1
MRHHAHIQHMNDMHRQQQLQDLQREHDRHTAGLQNALRDAWGAGGRVDEELLVGMTDDLMVDAATTERDQVMAEQED